MVRKNVTLLILIAGITYFLFYRCSEEKKESEFDSHNPIATPSGNEIGLDSRSLTKISPATNIQPQNRPQKSQIGSTSIQTAKTNMSAESIATFESDPPVEIRPDYTADEFKRKFRSKPILDWLRESKPYDFSGKIAPNDQEAYLLRSIKGEHIQFRQSMSLQAEGQNQDDCVSLKLPGQPAISGFLGEGTLEVRQTNVKWTFIIILQKKHYFIEHIDSSKWNRPVLHESAIYYYYRDKENQFHFRGELVGRDPSYPTDSQGGHLYGPDHCLAPYEPEI